MWCCTIAMTLNCTHDEYMSVNADCVSLKGLVHWIKRIKLAIFYKNWYTFQKVYFRFKQVIKQSWLANYINIIIAEKITLCFSNLTPEHFIWSLKFSSMEWLDSCFVCFRWMNPLFKKGYDRQLEVEDMYNVVNEDQSEILGNRLEE